MTKQQSRRKAQQPKRAQKCRQPVKAPGENRGRGFQQRKKERRPSETREAAWESISYGLSLSINVNAQELSGLHSSAGSVLASSPVFPILAFPVGAEERKKNPKRGSRKRQAELQDAFAVRLLGALESFDVFVSFILPAVCSEDGFKKTFRNVQLCWNPFSRTVYYLFFPPFFLSFPFLPF